VADTKQRVWRKGMQAVRPPAAALLILCSLCKMPCLCTAVRAMACYTGNACTPSHDVAKLTAMTTPCTHCERWTSTSHMVADVEQPAHGRLQMCSAHRMLSVMLTVWRAGS
jgi:hypothetical protein